MEGLFNEGGQYYNCGHTGWSKFNDTKMFANILGYEVSYEL